MWKPPYPWREFVRAVAGSSPASRCFPAVLVSIAFGATIALQVGNVARQLGAESQTGAAMVLAIVREAAPIVAALLIAGAGGSAMTADLGSRKIRDEIAAMEVLAVNPIAPLVVPAIWAAVFVAMLLDGFVSRRRASPAATSSTSSSREVRPARISPSFTSARAARRPLSSR